MSNEKSTDELLDEANGIADDIDVDEDISVEDDQSGSTQIESDVSNTESKGYLGKAWNHVVRFIIGVVLLMALFAANFFLQTMAPVFYLPALAIGGIALAYLVGRPVSKYIYE